MLNEKTNKVVAWFENGFVGEPNQPFMFHDSLARYEFYDGLKRQIPLEPEKLLMVAVLEDAIDCYQRYAASRRRKWQRVFADAETWFMEEDGDWLFSFANICAVLGLSPGFIRAGLLRWKKSQLPNNSLCKVSRFCAPRSRTKREAINSSRQKKVNCRITA